MLSRNIPTNSLLPHTLQWVSPPTLQFIVTYIDALMHATQKHKQTETLTHVFDSLLTCKHKQSAACAAAIDWLVSYNKTEEFALLIAHFVWRRGRMLTKSHELPAGVSLLLSDSFQFLLMPDSYPAGRALAPSLPLFDMHKGRTSGWTRMTRCSLDIPALIAHLTLSLQPRGPSVVQPVWPSLHHTSCTLDQTLAFISTCL